MIGLIVVSHGNLAEALITTAAEIVGAFDHSETLAVSQHQSLDEVEAHLRAAVERVDGGDGVLILTDMFGSTAANVALRLVGDLRVEVLTGCNLPMLLKLSSEIQTATDLLGLARLLKQYGGQNIRVASEILKERERSNV